MKEYLHFKPKPVIMNMTRKVFILLDIVESRAIIVYDVLHNV
jgi:hypothetical protein